VRDVPDTGSLWLAVFAEKSYILAVSSCCSAYKRVESMNIAITTQRIGHNAMVLVTAIHRVRTTTFFAKKLLSL